MPGPTRDDDLVVTSFQDITPIKQVQWRLSFLLRASALLGETTDYRDTLSRVSWLVVPSVADWCSFDVLGEGGDRWNGSAMAHVDPEMRRRAEEIERRWPPDFSQPGGLQEVMRRRRAVHVREVTDDMLTGRRSRRRAP